MFFLLKLYKLDNGYFYYLYMRVSVITHYPFLYNKITIGC